MKRKIFSILLAVSLIVSLIPSIAFAEVGSEDNTTKPIKVEYTDKDGMSQTKFFDYFGEEDGVTVNEGLNNWLSKNTTDVSNITITLLSDITVEPTSNQNRDKTKTNLKIPKGKEVTLNLSGYSITGGWHDSTSNSGIISNAGTLTANGPGTIENKNGPCIGSGGATSPKAQLSVTGIVLKNLSTGTTGKQDGAIRLNQGSVNQISGCTFEGGICGIKVAMSNSSIVINSINDCTFSNCEIGIDLKYATVNTIEDCKMNVTERGIDGSGRVEEIKNTAIISGNLVSHGTNFGTIDGGSFSGKSEEYSSNIKPGVFNGGKIGTIKGDVSITGENLAAIKTSSSFTIESGSFSSNTPHAVVLSDSEKTITINGGIFEASNSDFPISVTDEKNIVTPFGQTLKGEQTYQLAYDTEKVQRDTAAALNQINSTDTNDETKKTLAQTLQNNINNITDESMRKAAQEQADKSLPQAIIEKVTITLYDGDAILDTLSVMKGSIPFIDNPSKTGYIFDGWFTDIECLTEYDSNAVANNTLTLYAKWVKKDTSGGGSTIPTIQRPVINSDDHSTVTLSYYGTIATIKVADGYELVDVILNGESLGKVTTVTGLKTGDELVVTTISKEELAEQEHNAYLKKGVQNTTIKAWSERTKKGIKVYFKKSYGFKVDGYEFFRSTKKSTFGKKPYYVSKKTTARYLNNTKNLKKGTYYFYKIRGFRTIGGEKVYTKWSNQAIRKTR